MKLFIASGIIFLLLTGMTVNADHVYGATIGPFQDTLVPNFNNELTFLEDGEEMDGSPENWKYSLEGIDVKVISDNGKNTVRCEAKKNERNAILIIRMNLKVVFKKSFPVVVMNESLRKRIEAIKKSQKK
ncbi:hypothetical protein BH09BAC5_BH09BAC5_27220 [soil metagenome]